MRITRGTDGMHRVKRAVRRGRFGRFMRRWHWFDHPEMQDRIAEAEADRRAGRVTRMETPQAIRAYLEDLA